MNIKNTFRNAVLGLSSAAALSGCASMLPQGTMEQAPAPVVNRSVANKEPAQALQSVVVAGADQSKMTITAGSCVVDTRLGDKWTIAADATTIAAKKNTVVVGNNGKIKSSVKKLTKAETVSYTNQATAYRRSCGDNRQKYGFPALTR